VIFDLKLTKTDLITIVLLSVLFFSIAAYNVGESSSGFATTRWESTTNASFYVDLGSSQQVETVYFFVRQGNATVSIASGLPGNWNYVGSRNLEDDDRDFYKFYDMTLNTQTQYLQFNITAQDYDARPQFYRSVPNPTDKEPTSYIGITEIGLTNTDKTQVVIQSITGLNNTDTTINRLVDE
jgi:hypothetical protein